MAGNYPDAPSWRMAYDRDGSIGFLIRSASITQLTGAQLAALNSEVGTVLAVHSSINQWAAVGLIFPELRDLDQFFARLDAGTVALPLQVSADTTNGLDGTWTTLSATGTGTNTAAVGTDYRTQISSATALAVRGVRFALAIGGASGFLASMRAMHFYGERSPGQAVNALELWHPTSDEKLPPAFLDWGNTPRGSSDDRTFRVKNVSGTSTAEDVRVAMDVLTDGVPSVPGQHLLSYGGGSFLAQVNVGVLAPGAISGPVTLRRVMASNAQLGLFAFRVFAEPDAWS